MAASYGADGQGDLGDDDLSPYWHGTSERSGNLIGPYSHWDDRAGMSPTDISTLASFFQDSQLRRGGGNVSASEMQSVGLEEVYGSSYAHERAIILINAFRFEDVMKMKRDAPCVWSMFISVPLHQGLTFNNVLRTMARTATPYVGENNDERDADLRVPPGKVLMGEPVEVQAPEKGAAIGQFIDALSSDRTCGQTEVRRAASGGTRRFRWV